MAEGLLAGDMALVTGAASGIGRGIALELAREGARVVLADLDAARGADAAAALTAEGRAASFIAADLAAPDGADRLFDAALAELGSLSILVHSASPRRPEDETVFDVADEDWERMLSENLRSGFRLRRRAGR